jgi:sec-independent protein translocase protein TatA
MPSLGPLELGVIVFIILLLFGAKQLPKMGRAVGDTIRELRGAAQELTGEAEEAAKEVNKTVKEISKK